MACALCDQSIDEPANSAEHIILNAIGGRKMVRGILCAKCNSRAGSNWDGELARQLRPLALLFGVERQDGQETPPRRFETASGDQFWLNADGSMSPASPPFRKIPRPGGGSQIQINARSIEDARRILRGVAAKYPEVDYEKALASAESRAEYLDDALKMTLNVGGELAGRSIVKSAFCLAVATGVDAATCSRARAYLEDKRAEPPFGYYYTCDLIRNRPAQVPLHCVAISTRDTAGQLLGYVEIFGLYRMVVCLADHYDGPDVHASYAVNPMTGQHLELDLNLGMPRAEVAACFAYERIPDGACATIVDELMPVARKRSFELERDRVILRAFHCAMKACGVEEGTEIPPEKRGEITRLLAEQIMPFVIRHRNPRRDW